MVISLLTSTLGIIIRYTDGYSSIYENNIFVSSILYLPTNQIVLNVIKLNPIYFIVEGYRYSILYHKWFFLIIGS